MCRLQQSHVSWRKFFFKLRHTRLHSILIAYFTIVWSIFFFWRTTKRPYFDTKPPLLDQPSDLNEWTEGKRRPVRFQELQQGVITHWLSADTSHGAENQSRLCQRRWKHRHNTHAETVLHRGANARTGRGTCLHLQSLTAPFGKNKPCVVNKLLQTLKAETVSYQQQAPSSEGDNIALDSVPASGFPGTFHTLRSPEIAAKVSGMPDDEKLLTSFGCLP